MAFAYAEPHAPEIDGEAAELTQKTLSKIAAHLVERVHPKLAGKHWNIS